MVYTKMIGNWTVFQWLIWLALTLVATVGCYLWVRMRKKSVTEPGAKAKVAKALKKHSPYKDAVSYIDLRLNLGEKQVQFDNVLIGDYGVLLVKTFHRGVVVYGEPRKETWRIVERGYDEEVPNPLLALEEAAEDLRQFFAKHDIYKIPMQPLAVFAETAMRPELNLSSTRDAIVYDEIPAYLKKKFFKSAALASIQQITELLEKVKIEPIQEVDTAAQA